MIFASKKKNKKPIYLQLREIIRNKIEEGEYLPGTAIPSENMLAKTYDVNRITARNAVSALVNEGLLRRVQGKGVFVVGHKNVVPIEELGGFTNDYKNNLSSTKEVKKIVRKAGNKYSTIFNINVNDDIYYINHIQYVVDSPCAIQEFFIVKSALPSLDTISTSVFSIKDVLSFYGIELHKMKQKLNIIRPSDKLRKLLKVPSGVAIMLLECDYYVDDKKIIAHSISYIRSDMQSFTVSLHK